MHNGRRSLARDLMNCMAQGIEDGSGRRDSPRGDESLLRFPGAPPTTGSAAAASSPTLPSPPSSASTTSSPDPRASGAQARPQQLPENYWNAAASAIKPEFWQSYQELATRDAAEQIRRQTLPKAPDFKVELPKDFTLPQGMQWQFDAAAPEIGKLRELAAEAGWSQDHFPRR